MDAREIVKQLNELAPPAMKTLRGKVVSFDPDEKILHLEFQSVEQFTHSGGIVQGGFVTGMLDAAMTHAVYEVLQDLVIVPTLEIKVNFLEIARFGLLHASGRVVRLGKSIAFLDSELRDPQGNLLATATSTARVIHAKPVTSGSLLK